MQDVVLKEFLIKDFRLYVVPPFSSFVSPRLSMSEHRATTKQHLQASSMLPPWPLSKSFPPFQLSSLHFFSSFFSVFLFFCTWVSQLNVQGILPQRMFSLNIRSICVSLILSVHRRKVVIKFAAVLLHTLEAPCSHYCTEICHPEVLKWFSSVHSGKTRYSPQISISFTSLVFSLLFISIKQCK
jgi:hypothetical protein